MKIITKNENHEELLEDSKYQKLQDGKYTVDDFALVRTPDYLPSDKKILPLCDTPFLTHTTNVPNSVIFKILQEKYNLNPFDDDDYEKLREMANRYSPLSSQYRSTIHFTLNGLVSSHSKGNFDGRNFIIIDKLSSHLGKENFRSLRMEDTFIKGPFEISDKAIILINKDKYEKLLEENPWLQNYNVTLYTGDEKEAVETVLLDLGITPETIGEHGAEYSKRTPLYKDALSNLAKTHNCSEEKHFYSDEYKEDDQKSLQIWEIFNSNFYQELCNAFKIEPREETINFLSSYNFPRPKLEEKLKELINRIGLEEYCEFVLSYNKTLLNTLNTNNLLTNNELLKQGKLNISTNITCEKTYQ